MIRTKDFVVLLSVCSLVLLIAGFFLVSSDPAPTIQDVPQIVYFGESRNEYGVLPYTFTEVTNTRMEFIDAVREAHVPKPREDIPLSTNLPEVVTVLVEEDLLVEEIVPPMPLPMPLIEAPILDMSNLTPAVPSSTTTYLGVSES